MGKGEIISGGTAGQYQVKMIYNRDRYNATIAALNGKRAELVENRIPVQADYDAKFTEVETAASELNVLVAELADLYTDLESLQTQLDALRNELAILENEDPPDPDAIDAKRAEITDKQNETADKEHEIKEKQLEVEEKQKEANGLSFELALINQQLSEIDLEITAIDKRKETLEDNMPADATVSAWCADLTEDLSGYVGTVEIPGELGTLQIQPGYDDNAVYDQDRDGQLFPTVSMTPAQAFYNAAMLPGWQKWQPVFRHGTITAIDHDANTASITLDAITSSAQALDINRVSTLANVDIEYMFCDSSAFAVDDEVLVMFSATAEMTARFSALNTLRSELGVLLKALSVLRNELYALEGTTLTQMMADLNALQSQLIVAQGELSFLQDELADLLLEDPQDPDAIAAKEAEIATKETEIDWLETQIADKEAAIESRESDIAAKQAEVDAKQDEVDAKKGEINTKIDEIKANMADFAVPKIIGFKDHPMPCCEIVESFTNGEFDWYWPPVQTLGTASFEQREEFDNPFKEYYLQIQGDYFDIHDSQTNFWDHNDLSLYIGIENVSFYSQNGYFSVYIYVKKDEYTWYNIWISIFLNGEIPPAWSPYLLDLNEPGTHQFPEEGYEGVYYHGIYRIEEGDTTIDFSEEPWATLLDGLTIERIGIRAIECDAEFNYFRLCANAGAAPMPEEE